MAPGFSQMAVKVGNSHFPYHKATSGGCQGRKTLESCSHAVFLKTDEVAETKDKPIALEGSMGFFDCAKSLIWSHLTDLNC